MALETKLYQKLSQQLVMTPQLRMAIKILQVGRMELEAMIVDEMAQNPTLEEVAESVEEPKLETEVPTVDGQTPTTATKGFLIDVAPRLAYALENTGSEPVVIWRVTPAGQMPSYPISETPTQVKGWKYIQAKITSTGGYDAPNQPFLDYNAYAAAGGKSRDFAFDGHTSAHIIRAGALKEVPPSTSWGHFHENMVEAWAVIEGQLDVLISGHGLVTGQLGDIIMVPNERWHRATTHPNSGPSTRLAMTPRLKEGQIHYFQTDQPPGN